MASSNHFTTIIFTFLTGFGVLDLSGCVQVKIDPSEGVLRKYVGDTLTLTCAAKYLQQEDAKLEMSWIIPTNAVSRVLMVESPGMVKVVVKDLEETDAGNYTCDVMDELAHAVKSSIYILVLPRGKVSHCGSDSFYCKSGQCISNRYKCDGIPDCPDSSDESPTLCGVDVCSGKLTCEDRRCLSNSLCCRERDLSPPNCTIMASIQCCRQLVHPALLDQDLYYLEARPHFRQQWKPRADSTLIMGCIVAVANLVTVGIIVGVRYHLWRSSGSSSRAQYHLTRLRAATLRPFGLGSSVPPPSNTDQYQLGSADSLYSRRIPGLRSDLLAPEILREQRQQNSHSQRQFNGGVVLCPPSSSQPPQYSQMPNTPSGPPPAYHQVVGAPPPPYSSRDDLAVGSGSDGSSLSLLSPLLSISNNNNGDINSNTTTYVSVLYDRNLSHATASSTSSNCSSQQIRTNK